jgi:hypothetical protein
MKRLALVLCLVAGAAAGPASAADLCVGAGGGCFATLQAAVNAAHDGDTIHLRRGTFAGGVTIDKSVTIAGAGSHATTIAGGGPVLTIFREPNPAGLSVSIRNVTITGGVNDMTPDSLVTFGGGIWIPTSQLPGPPFNGTGATVTIDDSVITGNVVTSREAIPPGPFCGPHPCGFNTGGGIDNGGVLTITDSRITNNTAGWTASFATLASGVGGGGINNRFTATLVLRHSIVSGNRASVSLPNGQAASAGGIGSGGALTIENSVINDNSAELMGAPPGEEAQEALAGGVIAGGEGDTTVTIRNTLVHGNRALARVDRPETLSIAFAGGLLAAAPLVMERTLVTDNLARAVSAGSAAADGGGLEVDGPATIRDSVIARNTVVAEAEHAALAEGGGIANAGQLTLERTLVLNNRAIARGAGGPLPFGEPSGARGGGIWNASFGGPPPTLSLLSSVVAGNSLDAPAGFVLHGGGLFTRFPVTRTRSVIAGNRPDQCFGC